MGPTALDIARAAMTPDLQPAMPGAPKQEIATRVAQQVKEKNYREANKIARGALPDQQKSDQKAKQMWTDRDEKGNKIIVAGSEVEKRVKRTEAADARVRKFLTGGYDSLSPSEKTKIREVVLKAARKSPFVASQLGNTGVTQAKLDAFAERKIKEDPKFAAEAAENFDRWIDSPKLADIVTPLEIKTTEAIYKRDLAKFDFDDVTGRLTNVTNRLTEYDRTAGGTKGAKAQELDVLKSELPKLQETAVGWKGNITDINNRLELLRRGTTTAISLAGAGEQSKNVVDLQAVETAEGQLKDARNELAKIENKVQRISDLELEETTLKENKRGLEREKIEKDVELKKADLELTKASGELADAKALRESQEEDMVKGIEDIFLRAAEGTFDNQADAFLEAADEQVAAFAAEAKEANQKALDKILQERYVKPRLGTWYRKEGTVIDKKNVNEDYALLMKQGPEDAMRKILEKSKNPTTNVDYTTAEIDALLQDKEYVESVQPVMMTYLLAQRMVASGVTQEDTRIITMSSWGEDIITNALDVNKKVTSQVERLIDAKYLDRHGFMDRLKSELSKNPALWLLILAGGLVALPAGLIGGVGAAATYGAVGGITGGAGAGISYINRAGTIAPEEEAALAA